MNDRISLVLGDCIEELKKLAENSADSFVADPPYGIRFMGKAWDGADIEKMATARDKLVVGPGRANTGRKSSGITPAMAAGKYDLSNQANQANQAFQQFSREWGQQAFRVLKPGAHLASFASTRTYHRMACGIEDAGFEIRDQLAWVFGSGFPKSSNQEGEWEGWGTALKPAWEPIVLARKPLIGTVPKNLAAHRTGALNIAGCRVEGAKGSGNWKGMGGSAGKLYEGGFSKPTKSEQDADGRWPANLCHDGSEEVLGAFPDASGAQGAVRGTEPSAAADGTRCFGKFSRTANSVPRIDQDESAARFFYCAKASAADREAGLEMAKLAALAYGNQAQAEVKRGNTEHTGNSGMNTVKMRANIHPTVKPTDLMRWLCRLVTPPNGLIIDPFMGSGSTGRGAVLEGFRFIGIEKEPLYMPIATSRIREAAGELFTQ